MTDRELMLRAGAKLKGIRVRLGLSVREVERPLDWQQTYEWAALQNSHDEFGAAFARSIHIIVVDAGDCGACLNEVKQLNNPYYNMHRLGFFITPTPRPADVLLVVGAVTDHMRFVVQKIYDAMPTPKRVVAVGVCASRPATRAR